MNALILMASVDLAAVRYLQSRKAFRAISQSRMSDGFDIDLTSVNGTDELEIGMVALLG